MNNQNLDKDKLMELINSVKMYSGCEEVELYGNSKSFEELMALGFPLGEFKCQNTDDFLDTSKLYIIPIDNSNKRRLRIMSTK